MHKMKDPLKINEWVEFEPTFFSMMTRHGKIVGYDSNTKEFRINSQGDYFKIPLGRIKRRMEFGEVMFGV